jgi:hypothetical protein
MARPIPYNENSREEGHTFDADAFAPAWDMRAGAVPRQGGGRRPRPARRIRRGGGPVPGQAEYGGGRSVPGLIFLLVSGVVGCLAVVAALDIWPILSTADVRLEEREVFYLLAGGVYLLATTVYAGWRTRLMRDLSGAPWDARLMAAVNMAVGAALVFALGMVIMAAVAVVLILLGLSAILLSRPAGRPGARGSAQRGMGAWGRR